MAKRLSENARRHVGETVTIRWGVSRGQNSYGYTTCSLRNHHGKKVAACNGGGYDLKGTVIGDWVATTFPKELNKLPLDAFPKRKDGPELYGLTFHDPNYDPGKAPSNYEEGMTVAEAEATGKCVGLERYQAVYAASSPVPTKRHTIPSIDGACGVSCVLRILRAIGLDLHQVASTSKLDVYTIVKAE